VDPLPLRAYGAPAGDDKRDPLMRMFGREVPMMASLVIWIVLWEIVGRAGLVFLLPPFSEVLAAMGELFGASKFWSGTVTTLRAFAIGMVAAIAVGVPLGVLMGRSKTAERLLGMWVNIFVSAPLSALVPILMILFGLGETTVIMAVFLFAVWIIALDTQAGVAHMQRSLEEMAHSYGATPVQLYGKIILWAALPEILAGIRIGFIRGVKGVVVGQLLVSIIGYGELFELYSRNFLMAEFWALTIILFAFAMIIAEAVGVVEKRIEYYAGVR
jgi:NitT/TauT family transport system permease protein